MDAHLDNKNNFNVVFKNVSVVLFCSDLRHFSHLSHPVRHEILSALFKKLHSELVTACPLRYSCVASILWFLWLGLVQAPLVPILSFLQSFSHRL